MGYFKNISTAISTTLGGLSLTLRYLGDSRKKRKTEWLPTDDDYEYVKFQMKAVYEPGQYANWISPPRKGINGKPVDFEYVKFHLDD